MYWQAIYTLIYIVMVMGVFFGLTSWRLNRRKTRHPLGQDVKLRRQPGEHLRMRMSKALEYLLYRFLVLLLLLPAAVFIAALHICSFVLEPLAVGILAAPVAALMFGMWNIYYGLGEVMNLKLGLFGERVVADQLEGLKQKGYEVFHDVPCLGGGGRFNLDHVVVGRGVVVVVETKTRRKLKGDKEGHKLSYNGQFLAWPGGKTSTGELEQAQRNAEWLRKELKTHLNVDTVVHPVLTFPGWYVTGGPPQAPVLVTAHKSLPNFIENRFKPRLTEAETDAVARHMNRLCTDLGYADVE
ncbi:MAG: NERD domain-containing protein [Prosthecobacter sp.]|nr:NERD domain-containing protein [Prosthecobacter sp.]